MAGADLGAPPQRPRERTEVRDRGSEEVRGAGQLLGALLSPAAGGTVVLDEGGAPDLELQGLVRDLLDVTLPARLVLITAAQSAADAGMLADLLGRLAPRCVRVPPLR